MGEYFTCEVGGVPVVIVHRQDDQVRAFVNICRHRHNPVVQGAGNRRLLMCHYQACTYKLDESFNAAPRSKEDPKFDGCGLSLRPAGIDVVGQMIFVNPSNDAPSLLDVLGPIPDRARSRGVPIDAATFRASRSMENDANWKILWDNNVECYHCPTVHNSWYRVAKLNPEHVYSYPIGPFHFEHVVDLHASASSGINTDYSYCGWPSFCLTTDCGTGDQFHSRQHAVEVRTGDVDQAPAHAGYFMWRWLPVSARRTKIESPLYSVDVVDEKSLEQVFDGLFSVIREDREICESVQRSHDSEFGEPGTLIPAIDSEYATLTWERLVHDALTEPDGELCRPILGRSETWPADVPAR